MKKRAFTLIEIIICISIIMLLIGILLPVLYSLRRKSYQSSCISNIRQIGSAILLYSHDYDELLPWGGDPADGGIITVKNTTYNIPDTKIILHPYLKSSNVWKCPADFGLKNQEVYGLDSAYPSSFKKYGTSYFQITGLIALRRPISAISGEIHAGDFVSVKKNIPIGPSEICFLMDGSHRWHGNGLVNAWFLDGHVDQVDQKYVADIFWGFVIRETR